MSKTRVKYFAGFVAAIILAISCASAAAYAFINTVALLLPVLLTIIISSLAMGICGITCIASVVAAAYFKEQIRDVKSQRKSQKDHIFRVDATA